MRQKENEVPWTKLDFEMVEAFHFNEGLESKTDLRLLNFLVLKNQYLTLNWYRRNWFLCSRHFSQFLNGLQFVVTFFKNSVRTKGWRNTSKECQQGNLQHSKIAQNWCNDLVICINYSFEKKRELIWFGESTFSFEFAVTCGTKFLKQKKANLAAARTWKSQTLAIIYPQLAQLNWNQRNENKINLNGNGKTGKL